MHYFRRYALEYLNIQYTRAILNLYNNYPADLFFIFYLSNRNNGYITLNNAVGAYTYVNGMENGLREGCKAIVDAC